MITKEQEAELRAQFEKLGWLETLLIGRWPGENTMTARVTNGYHSSFEVWGFAHSGEPMQFQELLGVAKKTSWRLESNRIARIPGGSGQGNAVSPPRAAEEKRWNLGIGQIAALNYQRT